MRLAQAQLGDASASAHPSSYRDLGGQRDFYEMSYVQNRSSKPGSFHWNGRSPLLVELSRWDSSSLNHCQVELSLTVCLNDVKSALWDRMNDLTRRAAASVTWLLGQTLAKSETRITVGHGVATNLERGSTAVEGVHCTTLQAGTRILWHRNLPVASLSVCNCSCIMVQL